MGYVLPNRALGHELWRRLRGRAGIRVLSPATVENVTAAADSARVLVRQSERSSIVEARLIVAADGANSLVRTGAGVGLARRDYEQTAIVTSVTQMVNHKLERAIELLKKAV